MQNMSPEERERMLQRMRERGIDVCVISAPGPLLDRVAEREREERGTEADADRGNERRLIAADREWGDFEDGPAIALLPGTDARHQLAETGTRPDGRSAFPEFCGKGFKAGETVTIMTPIAGG